MASFLQLMGLPHSTGTKERTPYAVLYPDVAVDCKPSSAQGRQEVARERLRRGGCAEGDRADHGRSVSAGRGVSTAAANADASVPLRAATSGERARTWPARVAVDLQSSGARGGGVAQVRALSPEVAARSG